MVGRHAQTMERFASKTDHTLDPTNWKGGSCWETKSVRISSFNRKAEVMVVLSFH